MTNPPRPCVDGTYHCRCGNWSHDSPCPEAVGEVDIRSLFGRIHPGSPGSSWMVNLAIRTGGRWYSTVDRGECGNPEQFGDDLVISKLKLHVGAGFGEYGECNVCENGVVYVAALIRTGVPSRARRAQQQLCHVLLVARESVPSV